MLDTEMLFMYTPFALAGLALIRACANALKFSVRASTVKLALPIGAWMIPALSTRYSILPALTSATAPANIICKFIKDNKIVTIKGGIAEGEVIDAAKVEALGALPSKEVLLSKVAYCFKAPLQKVAMVFEAKRRKDEEATA